ncbi:MAG TPA: TolC family protein [Vicinamibacterales bacterium]
MTTVTARLVLAAGLAWAIASPHASAQTPGQPPSQPPLVLAQPEPQNAAPPLITLKDALDRARDLDAQYRSATTDAEIARQDRLQARNSLLPTFSNSTQYLGTQGDTPLATGRFVSNDGVNLWREWAIARGDITAGTFLRTPVKRAQAAEAAADARAEVARRGLAVTVTQRYYALVSAEHHYATSQQAVAQAQRFYDIAQRQQRLGQVAQADVIKAEISYRQQEQAFRDATLQIENARLALAVLLFPTFTQNFTVVDDLSVAALLPPFPDVRQMAGRENPDVRAATEALRVAEQEVSSARQAFLPTFIYDAIYGIEANEFALHSVDVAQPELGVLPNLGYFVTLNLAVPIWDWGTTRSKVRQASSRRTLAQVQLTQTQRQVISNLYTFYNEALTARTNAETAQRVAELAAESLRLTNLRYDAGESSALEVVDAQNTLVQARDAYDAALTRYRVALAELQTVTGPF